MLSGSLLWSRAVIGTMCMVKHRDRFCLTYSEMPQTMYESLRASAAEWGDKIALVDDSGREFSFWAVLERTDAFAARLASRHGTGKGSRVGILLHNSVEFAVAFFALSKLGAVAVPFPTRSMAKETTSLIEKAGLEALIYDSEFEGAVCDACARSGVIGLSCPVAAGVHGLDPGVLRETPPAGSGRPVSVRAGGADGGLNDDCAIMFTSGAASRSRGVILSNLNLMHSVVTYEKLLGLSSDDVSILSMPMHHVTGLAALLCLFIHIGGTLYLHRRFNPARVLDEVRARNATFLHASPAVFIEMLELRERWPALPSLRQLACGSANMPGKYLRELKAWLPEASFRTVYGLTETASPASVFPGDAAGSPHIGSSGMPIPGLLMKVVDEAGRELPNGQVGELVIRGAVVMEEYDHSDAGFLEDRWFRSGDLARLTDDGYVYITDRKADMIRRAGEKVCSYEVENLLHECPGVAEAAIVGIPDDIYGEIVAAMVRPLPHAAVNADLIAGFLKGRIARHKIPEVVRLAPEIPRTANGKVDKTAVRRALEARRAT